MISEKCTVNTKNTEGYSPRYVHFYEAALAAFAEKVYTQSDTDEPQKPVESNQSDTNKPKKQVVGNDIYSDWLEGISEGYCIDAINKYWDLNRFKDVKSKKATHEDLKKEEPNTTEQSLSEAEKKKAEKKKAEKRLKFLGISPKKHLTQSRETSKSEKKPTTVIEMVTFDQTEKVNKLTVGLVNFKLNKKYIEQSYLQNPTFDNERKENFNKLVNIINGAKDLDVIIFPEVSIAYLQLKELCKLSKDKKIMLIFGLEHQICNNMAFNFLVALIPFQTGGSEETHSRTDVFPLFRLKNHYSHHEKEILKRYRYNIPVASPARYHILNWRGVRMSIFNCFELADIAHRSLLRSEIDVLFASVYNKDTHYFSNIAETVVRDLHCFYVQSNDSNYGDSRVTRPMKKESMNQIQVKGGKNNTILIDTLDIEALRKFQIQEYHSDYSAEQIDTFKPKPPGFDVNPVMDRWGKNLNK